MKLKTHSGAKKRLKPLPGGKIKRKKKNRRHILSNKSRKRKRNLKGNYYVDDANLRLAEQMLVL